MPVSQVDWRVTRRVLPSILDAVRASGMPRSAVGPHRRAPIKLEEPAGVRLALVLLVTAPLVRRDRVETMAGAVAGMSDEESYYWYAKCMGADADARAERCVCCSPRRPVMGRPRVLIEDWLPVQELGIESRRERAAASALPPLSFLHVWWARRPLVASAGAVLGSLLPAWSQDLADAFPDAPELKTEKDYQAWFLRLCGILGRPGGGSKG